MKTRKKQGLSNNLKLKTKKKTMKISLLDYLSNYESFGTLKQNEYKNTCGTGM